MVIIALDSLLHVRGSQREQYAENIEIFYPLAHTIAQCVMLSIKVQKPYNMIQVDIRAAYLNGDLNSIVYMKQPKGADGSSGKLCKLRKAIYGLIKIF